MRTVYFFSKLRRRFAQIRSEASTLKLEGKLRWEPPTASIKLHSNRGLSEILRIKKPRVKRGVGNDPYGTRTRVTGVKGRCPNH